MLDRSSAASAIHRSSTSSSRTPRTVPGTAGSVVDVPGPASPRRYRGRMLLRRRPREHRAHHEPVLGTLLTVQVRARRRGDGERAERVLLAEIGRLEALFSVFRADSELSRWRACAGDGPVSGELAALLRLGPLAGTQRRRFQPGRRRGHSAVAARRDRREGAGLCRTRRRCRWSAGPSLAFDDDDGPPVMLGDCSALNFNALAKGLVVERACRHVAGAVEVDELLVNIGGDLRHVGEPGVVVAIEDPARPYDNAEPLARVRVTGAGLATSGSSRRGVRIGEQWFSHVIDPRTARPVEHVRSASVIAGDAATADVVATVLSVLE